MYKINWIHCVKEGTAVSTVHISASSTIFELVNKVCSAGSSSDKNTLDNDVLTEETFDKTGTRLENSPHKSLTRLKSYVYYHTKLDTLK
jgi:hypothetical protein